MIYFLDTNPRSESWAGFALSCMRYNSYPAILQTAIRQVFYWATATIKIEKCEVIPFALFDVLDGNTPEDYVARVEPSETGGRKMAKALVEKLYPEMRGEKSETSMITQDSEHEDADSQQNTLATALGAPTPQFMTRSSSVNDDVEKTQFIQPPGMGS
ncbi:unnamed protein product [Amoebophrya sp. A120]|nr:unnamed protein product [Amoebophrya sp. A120]|eukprot:GSA120T00004219001.1